jgi:hypothetical protein
VLGQRFGEEIEPIVYRRDRHVKQGMCHLIRAGKY